MRIIAENTAESDLLRRRLPALRHVLGQDQELTTNLHPDPLGRLLALLDDVSSDAADLERCWRLA